MCWRCRRWWRRSMARCSCCGIEFPSLTAVHAASIRQRGGSAGAVAGKLAIGTAQAAPALDGRLSKAAAVLEVLAN
jgi:hypothetical protein